MATINITETIGINVSMVNFASRRNKEITPINGSWYTKEDLK